MYAGNEAHLIRKWNKKIAFPDFCLCVCVCVCVPFFFLSFTLVRFMLHISEKISLKPAHAMAKCV